MNRVKRFVTTIMLLTGFGLSAFCLTIRLTSYETGREEYRQLQEQFDYSPLTDITIPIHMIYGDRGICEYADRIQDLNLPWETVKRLQFHFIRNACHMPMLEQCEDTYRCIENILYAATDKPAG